MSILTAHGPLASSGDPSVAALEDLFHFLVVFFLLVFVVVPAVWVTGTVAATRSLKKWPSLVPDTERSLHRWILLVGALPVVGPLIYAVSYRQARNRRTPEQLALARLTHDERRRRAQAEGVGRPAWHEGNGHGLT